MLHHGLVQPPVGLGPEGMDGGTLAPVQHPVLDAGLVCGQTHFAAQSVDFPDDVALAGAADGGVAGHIAHRVQVDGEQDGVHAKPGTGQCGFDARMTRADDGNVTASCVVVVHRVVLSLGR